MLQYHPQFEQRLQLLLLSLQTPHLLFLSEEGPAWLCGKQGSYISIYQAHQNDVIMCCSALHMMCIMTDSTSEKIMVGKRRLMRTVTTTMMKMMKMMKMKMRRWRCSPVDYVDEACEYILTWCHASCFMTTWRGCLVAEATPVDESFLQGVLICIKFSLYININVHVYSIFPAFLWRL